MWREFSGGVAWRGLWESLGVTSESCHVVEWREGLEIEFRLELHSGVLVGRSHAHSPHTVPTADILLIQQQRREERDASSYWSLESHGAAYVLVHTDGWTKFNLFRQVGRIGNQAQTGHLPARIAATELSLSSSPEKGTVLAAKSSLSLIGFPLPPVAHQVWGEASLSALGRIAAGSDK